MSNKDFKVKNGLTVTESLSVGAGANVVGLSASSTRNGFVSAGRDLADIFGGSGSGTIEGVTAGSGLSGGGTSGTVTLTVGRGDGVTITDNTVAVDSTVVRTSGNQTIAGCKTFSDNTTITGNLSVTGDITCIDTVFSVTSALSVVNEGTGPALVVQQNGSEPIAHFIDKNGDDIFFNDNGTIQTPYLSSGRNTCFGNCVGIGTNAPDHTLDVNGTMGINSYLYHNGDDDTHLLFGANSVNLVAGGKSALKYDASSGKVILNNTNANVDVHIMADDGNEILATDATNNRVGINTTSPDEALTISGNISSNGSLSASGSGRNYLEGRLGINTNRPDYMLDVAGSVGIGACLIHNGDDDTFISFTDDDINIQAGGVNFIDITQDTNNEITFNEAGADVDFRAEGDSDTHLLFVDAGNDKIGIGSATPGEKLTVSGNISASGSLSAIGDIFTNGDIILDEDQRIYFEKDRATWIESDSADRLRLVAGGKQMLLLDQDTGDRAVFGFGTKVGINVGNNTTPGEELTVSGNISANGHITTESLSVSSTNNGILSAGRDLADIFATSAGNVDGTGSADKVTVWVDSNTICASDVTAAELGCLDGLTSTTAELNTLDGFTGDKDDLNYAKDLCATGVTATEFNCLDGLTATTAELNCLDGLTATTAELNRVDGVTENIQLQTAQLSSITVKNIGESLQTIAGDLSSNGHITTESLNVSSTSNGILSAGRDLADIFATTSGNVDGSGTVNKLPVWTDSDTLGDSPLSSTGVCVNLQDDGKMLFGNNNDLKIYHNGSNSIIEDSGTGGLFLLADAATYIQTPTGESKAKFTKDAGVELFYDNSKKFETTNTGVDITGALSANGNITGNIVNVGTRVKATGSSLEFSGNGLDFVDGSSASYLFRGIAAGAFEAYHSGVKKFETTAAGANVIGGLSANGHFTTESLSVSSTNNGILSAGRDLADIFATSAGNVDGTGSADKVTVWADSNTICASDVTATELGCLDGLTSTTTELNCLDGLTSTTTELNCLDGLTSTTTELNCLDGLTSTTTELNCLDGLTSTTAELNRVDGVTENVQLQTAQLSSIKQATITGAATTIDTENLTVNRAVISNGSGKIAASDVTSTELGCLDGLTSTTAELNCLDGLTSTTAELNTLDGFTGDKDDLNYAKDLCATGVTTTEFDCLDGLTSTTAELNCLDGLTSTTAELNCLDGLTSTTAELNCLDGLTATTTELNYSDGVSSNIQTQLDGTVKTTGAQTIAGAKCFSDNVRVAANIYHTGDTDTRLNFGTNALKLEAGGGNQINIGTGNEKLTVSGNLSSNGHITTESISVSSTNNGILSAGRDLADIFATSAGNVDGTGSADKVTVWVDSNTICASDVTATELACLDGLTSTTTELNCLDGLTSTTTELNKLDGYTGDHNDLNYAKDLCATGVTTTEFDCLDGLTSTTAELNCLDGLTSTTAELNCLDGLTSTTTELNCLDGLTATTAELNYSDGVSSNIQTQLDATVKTTGNQTVAGCKTFTGNTTITGNLSVTGDITCIDTVFSVTSALSVVNEGTGPALVVQQNGSEPIAHFIDKNGDDIFFTDNGGIQTPYLSSGRNTCFTNCIFVCGDVDVNGNLETDAISINGTTVSSTAAELNCLDGLTATTAELNTLDGFNGDVNDLNYAKTLCDTGVTGTEFNCLDGLTSTTTELNCLDGLTSTTTELNCLDGLTSTTAELNCLDGLTSTTAELNCLDGLTSTTAELNCLDGLTSTTTELNKVDGFTGDAGDLNYAKDLCATGVTTTEFDCLDGLTSTTAELNCLDGLTSTTTELNCLDGLTATTAELNRVDGVTENVQLAVAQLSSITVKTTGSQSIGGAKTFTDDISVADKIIHNGDTDTFINFTEDDINIQAGGVNFIDLTQDTVSEITFNEAGANVDFRVEGDSEANLLFTDASTDRVGIGTDAPDHTLDVAGEIGLNEYLYHNGDNDTHLRFGANEVNLVAGGKSAIKYVASDSKIVLNNTNADVDVHIMADDGNEILAADAANNRVGINTTTPNEALTVIGNISSNGHFSTESLNVSSTNGGILSAGRDLADIFAQGGTAVDGSGSTDTVALWADSNTLCNSPVTKTELGCLDGLTSTTAELNCLDGLTSTTAELNCLDGLTSTTAELNCLDGLTSTTTELNKLDGYTGDHNDLNYAKDLCATGVTTTEFDCLDGLTSTTTELNCLDGLTSTTAELNKLDGFTGDANDLNYAKDICATGVTTTEFNCLDGLTSTTTELNCLDGLTSTTAELNTLDGFNGDVNDLNYAKTLCDTGVTGTEFNCLDGLTSTTTELNCLDGLTSTTTELNCLDGLTSTTAELNCLDGLTSTTAELNYSDGVTSNIQTQLDNKVQLTGKASQAITSTLSATDLYSGSVSVSSINGGILSAGRDLADIFATSAGSIDGSGSADTVTLWADSDTLCSSPVTKTELGCLDGLVSTTLELNRISGFTGNATDLNYSATLRATGVTGTEFNCLDGLTSTTAELNCLDGLTSTTTELNCLDGLTSTTAELNCLDGLTSTTAELNCLDGLTATTTELNRVDGVTENIQLAVAQLSSVKQDCITLTASRALVSTGAGKVGVSGVTSTEIGCLDGLTSTTAELNKLDGYTGDHNDLNYAKDLCATGVTTTEFDCLDGLTSTTAELNCLDGLTSTTTELNCLDGLTSTTAELNCLDGLTSTTTELNCLDGLTSTTTELNCLDGLTSTTTELNKLDGFTGDANDLNYAKDLCATGVTTTEFDCLDGLTSTTTELNCLDGLTSTTAELNLLDGSSANTVVNSKAAIYGSGGELAGTLSTAAQTNITSLGTLTTLTVDDITINGSTISDAGDFTLDVEGDINLDANGADICLKDGGTTFGRLFKSSNDFFIKNPISDGDIKFQVNDGGSGITVLSIDASDAGAATFSNDLTVQGDLTVTGDFTCKDTIVSVTSALSVTNTGTGPALFVRQDGSQPIAHFIDKNGDDILFADDGKICIGNSKLVLNGTTVSSTATELNCLDGLTSTTAELNKLDGFTGDVTDLNYAKTLYDTGVTGTEFNCLDGLTSTTAELNCLDGLTSTTTELNKLDGYTGDADDLNYAKDLCATGVTTTEFDCLDGLTSTTTELNCLDGLTSTTTELNKVDGFTGDAGDLNYAKDLCATGVTSTEFNCLDGLTSTTTELNCLDGLTSTTAELNKLDGFTGDANDLNYAKDLCATGVTTTEFDCLDGLTSTTTELNCLDGLTSTTTELNCLDGLTSTTAELNTLDGFTGDVNDLNYAKTLCDTGVTGTEFNCLDGLTSTTTELNCLDGLTSTTTELNCLDGLTSTTTELNLLDGITAGTVAASKAVIVDSNKDITGFRNFTNTGCMTVCGHFSACSKAFVIDHPTKPGKKLRHGAVEAPEWSVHYRGITDNDCIDLPDYWNGLVRKDSVTTMLTPLEKQQDLYVVSQDNDYVCVGGVTGCYNYIVYGERKDIDKLEVETDGDTN